MNANELRIAEPCTVDWSKMTPAEGGRFCGDCKKVVKSLSSMTEREAKKLLRSQNDGSLCVRFIYDAQGKVFFGADAPKADPLLPAAMLSRAKRFALAAGLAAASQACNAPDLHESPVIMGAMEYVGPDDPPVDPDAGSDAGSDAAAPDNDAASATGVGADAGADAAGDAAGDAGPGSVLY